MMIGGMIMGPLGAWLIKQVDKALDGHVKPGLEMLVDNFSMGILGALMMIVGFMVVTPIFSLYRKVRLWLLSKRKIAHIKVGRANR